MRALVLLWVVGCGRVGFDPSDARDAVAIEVDAPPLPASLLCSAQRIPVPAIAPGADLSVEWNGASFTAMWVDPTGAVLAMPIDRAFNAQQPRIVVPGPVEGIAGSMTTPTASLLVTVAAGSQTLWSSPQLTGATLIRTEARVAAHAPLITDATRVPRTWIRGSAGGIHATYVADDGTPSTDQLLSTANPVLRVAAANNVDHGHLSWIEDLGGGLTRCMQSDLNFTPVTPEMAGATEIANGCNETRNDSGPPSADAILTTWRGSTRSILLRYLGSIVNATKTLSARGRAPKVRFDGVRFWVAWIDEASSGNVLRVAAVEEDLTARAVDVPGWDPIGDEAFELVRTDGTVYLFVLGADSLSILRTCSGSGA